SDIFLPILYCTIFITGIVGNLFVISVMGISGSRGGRLVDTFVVNLALADLIFVLSLPLWAVSASQNGNWNFGPAGDLLCKLSSYIIAVNRFSNIFFLTCMSVDRYLAVVKLMDSSLTMALLTFIFPLLIIVLCYGTIIAHLNKHCVVSGNPRTEARRRHSLKMVLSIIVVFVVSWLPFNIFKFIIIVSQLSEAESSCNPMMSWAPEGLRISCALAFLNSCVNPAIYLFLDNHFRRRAMLLFKTCTGKSKLLHNQNSSASFTNAGTSESIGTSVRTQMFE
ncbi:G-protein coupled receptor 15, partial [Nibea albiflora]